MKNSPGKRKRQIDKFKVQMQRSIRQMRIEVGLSQRELAAKMSSKVDQSTVSNWESGKTEMTSAQLLDLFLIFGKDMVAMYFGFLNNAEKESDTKKEQEEKES
ncbi:MULTISPECIES: helix-turn-helix transcriptional regulator [Pseudoalteromonas]|jgi:DNA-binding transcriptional regulator YiaG|nr:MULTISPECIES: helix-turn-helix transcriptional regulator [Pseudoalteromonas]MCO7189500.1 helix-turn-helix domain-containing protein [Pseudoalteromonas sp. XMcav2-N]